MYHQNDSDSETIHSDSERSEETSSPTPSDLDFIVDDDHAEHQVPYEPPSKRLRVLSPIPIESPVQGPSPEQSQIVPEYVPESSPESQNSVENDHETEDLFVAADTTSKNRHRAYAATLNNYTEAELTALNNFRDVSGLYFVYGLEIGAGETPHVQAYFHFPSGKTTAAVHKWITRTTQIPSRWALFYARGSPKQNKFYCQKGDQPKEEWFKFKEKGPTYGLNYRGEEFGTLPHQGQSSGIFEVVTAVQGGADLNTVANDYPELFIKHGRGIQHWYDTCPQPRHQQTIGYWITGPSGVGKSHWARNCVSRSSIYFKSDNTKWWNGYDPLQHSTVVWNDFRFTSDIPFAFLLQLLDADPIKVQTKGGYVEFRARRIIFTSTITAEKVFENIPFQVEGSFFQLKRRLISLEFSARSLIPYTKIQDDVEKAFEERVSSLVDDSNCQSSQA